MSIVRWDTDSDVYVYMTAMSDDPGGVAFECCACPLLRENGGRLGVTAGMKGWDAAVAHLLEHREKGHKVPEYAIENLRRRRES